MDFLDPNKQRAHQIRLLVGYVLIGLGILIATAILLYRAYGFGLDKDGEVVQNGLVFMASQPGDAEIVIDGKPHKDTTDTRFQLPEGAYSVDIRREGYHVWHRDIAIQGGSVSRYDYAFLIPTEITPTPLRNYAKLPGFATQSPDRRWLIVQQIDTVLDFDIYDLSDPEQVGSIAKNFSLPAAIVTAASTGDHSWKLTEWSTDNRRIILEHAYPGGTEYILVDHEDPERSLNLTRTLGLSAGQILSLRDKKYDLYYVFDPAAKTVATTSITDTTTHTPVLANALGFKSFGRDMLLYATEVEAPAGKVMTMLKDGEVTYKIRELNAGGPYLLDLARYDRQWYVVVGASSENKVYVFKNPQSVRKNNSALKNLVPVNILRTEAPNYIAFSSNTRFIMIENGLNFAVYDAETDKGYTYKTTAPLDPGVAHATWMDGHRLMYVSGGKVIIFDYDNINTQTLVPASPAFLPFFDRDYEYLYTLTPPTAATGQSILTSSSLRTQEDR